MAGESEERGSDVFRSIKTKAEGVVYALRAFGRTLGRRALARGRSSVRAHGNGDSGFSDHERVEAAKYSPAALPREPDVEELPDSYGSSRVALVVVDPYLIYAYWDIDTSRLPRGTKSAVLRLYDASDSFVAPPLDVDVDLRARNWYVHLWNPAKSYYADLGVKTEQDGFISLAVSNRVHTPRAWPAAAVRAIEPDLAPEPVAVVSAPVAVADRGTESAPPSLRLIPAPEMSTPQVAAAAIVPAVPEPINQQTAVAATSISKRVDADQLLRQKLEEIYALLPWNPPSDDDLAAAQDMPPANHFDLAPERTDAAPATASPPDAPADLTAIAERGFQEGLPSSLQPAFRQDSLAS